MTILAFGAHPDDIEFGCGGVIAREIQQGAKAHFVVGSRGEAATHGTPEERESEARKAAGILGATIEFVELGGDAHLEWNSARVIALAGIIRRTRPQVVLAPTTIDHQHPDHSVVGRLVRDAARVARYGGVTELKGSAPHAIEHLLHYAITVEGEPSAIPSIFVDLSDSAVMTAWSSAMEAHGSQAKTRDYVQLQLTRARLAGLRAGVEHAQVLFPSDPLLFKSLAQLDRSVRSF